jgi:hypothetical protein
MMAAGLIFLAVATSAVAHEGAPHVKGTIKEVTAERLVVAQPSGKLAEFKVTKATEFYREKKPVAWSEAKPGERVVVHGAHEASTPTAAVVMLGAAPEGH